jgi:type I restriction enzyme S subunit
MNKIPMGYKQTEVGIIPEDWDVKPLGILLKVRHGKSQHTVVNNGGIYPILATSGEIGRTNSYLYDKPSVLIGRKGTIDVPQYFDKPFWTIDTLFYTEIFNCVVPKYIYYKFLMIDWYLYNEASGVPSLNSKTIEKINVSFPTLSEEQFAIAEALSDVDVLISSLDELIAKKRNIKKGAMQELLTGKRRLPGFSGKWETKKLGEIATIGRGRVISQREINLSIHSQYPVYSSQTSNNGIMGFIDTYDFDGEYATWTTDGVNAGTVFYRNGKFNCTNVCGTIKPESGIETKFLSIILNLLTYKYVSRNLANPKLMNEVTKKIEVPLPKTKTEQSAIAGVLSDMDAEIEHLEQKRDKYKQVKQGMMQELLTGKTRLI